MKLKLRLVMMGVVCGLSFVHCSNRVFAMESEAKEAVSSFLLKSAGSK